MACAPVCCFRHCRWSVSGGGLKRKPTARFASGGGLETFSSLLAVSPRARSGNSLLSRRRGNRHGRLGRNSLGGGRQHYREKDSTRGDESEGKVWRRVAEVSKEGNLTCLQIFPEYTLWLPQEPAEIGVSKRRLEQVRPDSAFCNSEMSREVTWKPRASMRARVRGNEAGKIMAPARARALAAWGSAGSTSIHSWPARGAASNHARLARSVLRPRSVTADFR